MYLWKCWRDTRSTFLVLLGAVVVVSAYGAYVKFDPFGWIAAKPEEARFMWQGLANVLLNMTVQLVPVAGFILGALGVGVEFEKGTADFLLTRPRSRRYFLWTSWGLGAAQMLALVLLSFAANWLMRNASSPSVFGFDSVNVVLLAGISVVALFFYTLTHLMTTLARNSRHGTGLAIGVFTAYAGLYVWLRYWFDTQIPFFEEFHTYGHAAARSALPAMMGWLMFCLALMLVAQFAFERAEV